MSDDVGARIRRARLARTPRMTLADLAGPHLSISLVSKIERGLVRPSLATLGYLAERLGIPAAELLDGARDRAEADECGLALARARAALAADDPAGALAALDAAEGAIERIAAASALRATALLGLDRDDEALRLADATLPRLEFAPGRAARSAGAQLALVRAGALARVGRDDAAQDAYGRALDLAPVAALDLRAEALLGLARLAERTGSPSTARNFYRQAMAQLALAASPTRRADVLRREADELAGEDSAAARGVLAAAAELAGLARATAARAETASRLAELESGAAAAVPATRLREASDAIAQRSIRRDRNP